MGLIGDAGAASLLQAHPAWVHEVRFDYAAPADIDTPDDLPGTSRRP
jgi:CTP:molybdopterin cytidylyltransferase MocA